MHWASDYRRDEPMVCNSLQVRVNLIVFTLASSIQSNVFKLSDDRDQGHLLHRVGRRHDGTIVGDAQSCSLVLPA